MFRKRLSCIADVFVYIQNLQTQETNLHTWAPWSRGSQVKIMIFDISTTPEVSCHPFRLYYFSSSLRMLHLENEFDLCMLRYDGYCIFPRCCVFSRLFWCHPGERRFAENTPPTENTQKRSFCSLNQNRKRWKIKLILMF